MLSLFCLFCRSITWSPTSTWLTSAPLFLSAYSFSFLYLLASLPRICICHCNSSIASALICILGNLFRSLRLISISAGLTPVTVYGVVRYLDRKSRSSFFSTSAILMTFIKVELKHPTSPLLCGQYGTPFECCIPRYSRNPSNSAETNYGPLSLFTLNGRPFQLPIHTTSGHLEK